jgi:hypothetical protein
MPKNGDFAKILSSLFTCSRMKRLRSATMWCVRFVASADTCIMSDLALQPSCKYRVKLEKLLDISCKRSACSRMRLHSSMCKNASFYL